jgi:hypothetical protein
VLIGNAERKSLSDALAVIIGLYLGWNLKMSQADFKQNLVNILN